VLSGSTPEARARENRINRQHINCPDRAVFPDTIVNSIGKPDCLTVTFPATNTRIV
jgi:hypothetical protein